MLRTSYRNFILLLRSFPNQKGMTAFCSEPKITPEERKRHLRMKEIKEMEEMNQKFHRTKGNFNSLVFDRFIVDCLCFPS